MFKRTISGLALSIGFYAASAVAQIPPEVESLIEAREAAIRLCGEQSYRATASGCVSRNELTAQIEQAGWCYRWPMRYAKDEADGKYVSCNTTKWINSYIDIDQQLDRPEISNSQAEWALELYDFGTSGVEPDKNVSVGLLSFTCNSEVGAEATISVKDESSGVTGEPFISEFVIEFMDLPANVEISHSAPDTTRIVFGPQNTLGLLNWVHSSIGAFRTVGFRAREISSERQIDIRLKNLSEEERYSGDADVLLQWSTDMISACESVGEQHGAISISSGSTHIQAGVDEPAPEVDRIPVSPVDERQALISPTGLLTGAEEVRSLPSDCVSQEPLNYNCLISSATFSPDGRLIVTGSLDKTIKLWEVDTGRLVRTFDTQGSYVHSATFSPDGQFVVAGLYDGTAKLWETSTGDSLHTLEGHENEVRSAVFNPDGRRVITGSKDGTVKLWDVSTGQFIRNMDGHRTLDGRTQSPVNAVAFNPDGKMVAVGSSATTVNIIETSTGRLISMLTGHRDSTFAVAFSPDGRFLLTGAGDNTAWLWEVSTGNPIRSFKNHKNGLQAAAFSPDGRFIVTGSLDNTAKLWAVDTGRLIHTLEGHGSDMYAAAFSPDGRFVVTGDRHGNTTVWELEFE